MQTDDKSKMTMDERNQAIVNARGKAATLRKDLQGIGPKIRADGYTGSYEDHPEYKRVQDLLCTANRAVEYYEWEKPVKTAAFFKKQRAKKLIDDPMSGGTY